MLAVALFALAQPADPAATALKPLRALAGSYTTVTTEYDLRTGQPRPPVKGTERILLRAGGQIVVCDRQADDGYDDILIYQYDAEKKEVRGFMFMPLREAKPRLMTATVEGSAVVLEYEPLVQGEAVFRSRETITRRPDGGYTRLVERKQADGSFLKRREIVGTPTKGGK